MIEPQVDPIVEEVIQRYRERSEVGLRKYGVPMTRKDISLPQWLRHLQEELMDGVIYIQRALKDLEAAEQTGNLAPKAG